MIDSLYRSVVAIWIIPSNSVKEIYDNTTEGSTLRRMLVEMYASLAADELAGQFTLNSDVYTKGFLCDLVKSIIATIPRRSFLTKEQYQKVEICPSFHVHEEGVKCTKRGNQVVQQGDGEMRVANMLPARDSERKATSGVEGSGWTWDTSVVAFLVGLLEGALTHPAHEVSFQQLA
jgi:hypothetical protein